MPYISGIFYKKKTLLKKTHSVESQKPESVSRSWSVKIHKKTQACNVIKKETLANVISCDFCKIFKNTSFYRTPPVAVSEKQITTWH